MIPKIAFLLDKTNDWLNNNTIFLGHEFKKDNLKDSELDIKKSIEENFNLLRIGNNEKWPSFFNYKGKKYIIKIYEEKKDTKK